MGYQTETELLLGFLDEQRNHVLGILEGLTEEQLRRPVLPSGWHCLGMVKHLALADEHYWFRSVVGGEPFDFLPEGENAEWRLDPGESAADVFALYREEIERSKRYDTPLSFMIIDVDHFKTYNDIYGHTNADLVLIKTAQLLRSSIRAIDMSARFAGDEFCVVLPETELDTASRVAERLRRAISETEFSAETGERMGRVTLSIGLSSFSPTRQSPLAVIEAADRALYQAKMRGRNCVAVYDAAD